MKSFQWWSIIILGGAIYMIISLFMYHHTHDTAVEPLLEQHDIEINLQKMDYQKESDCRFHLKIDGLRDRRGHNTIRTIEFYDRCDLEIENIELK